MSVDCSFSMSDDNFSVFSVLTLNKHSLQKEKKKGKGKRKRKEK